MTKYSQSIELPCKVTKNKIKSDNLQYTTLVCWADWKKQLVDQVSDVPSIFFFTISYRLRALKTHFYNFEKNKGFLQRILQDVMKKIIRHLDDEPFVPSAQRTSVLYCRL